MTEQWKPGEFKDTYHDDLMARIKEKIKQGQTKEITEPGKDDAEKPRSAQVIDLAELLRQEPRRQERGVAQGAAQGRRDARKPALRVVSGSRVRPRPPPNASARSARAGAGRSPWHWRSIGPSAISASPPSRAGRPRARPSDALLVRDPEARGEPSALRLPARARRRAAVLGRAQGAEPRSGGQAARDARRGSSARVRQLRRRDPRSASTAAAP